MPCTVVETSFGSAFFCSEPDPAPEPCAFCGDPSTRLCDWPVEKQGRRVRVGDLKAGDWIYVSERSPDAKEIVQIEQDESISCLYTLYIAGLKHSPIEKGTRRRYDFDTFLIRESGTCDKPCCDACHRSVDDDVDYCRDHWRQEEIA